MISNEFLCLLTLLMGRDDSQAEISAATVAYQKLLPEGIELLCAAMNWSEAEQDLMVIQVRFCRTHNRAPSRAEFQQALGEHLRLYGTLMTPEERSSLEQLLAQGAKIAGFKAIKPETKSTKPANPETAKRVQQISQPTPKPVQQRKPRPKVVKPVDPELPEPFKLIKPEILAS
jgi:hypothetical protein